MMLGYGTPRAAKLLGMSRGRLVDLEAGRSLPNDADRPRMQAFLALDKETADAKLEEIEAEKQREFEDAEDRRLVQDEHNETHPRPLPLDIDEPAPAKSLRDRPRFDLLVELDGQLVAVELKALTGGRAAASRAEAKFREFLRDAEIPVYRPDN
jgi:hypothetical protein